VNRFITLREDAAMAERLVTHTGKDPRTGDITRLCNASESWSPRAKADAIADIEKRLHAYLVRWKDMTTEIKVVQGLSGKYLRTDRDNSTRNNLEDLPDC
jgi:hypothetical protein